MITLLVGISHGLVFGSADVEDKGDMDYDIDLLATSELFMPITAVYGLFLGFINEIIRLKVLI